MKRILTLLLVIISFTVSAQSWVNTGNTLQFKVISVGDTVWRFSLGAPGFLGFNPHGAVYTNGYGINLVGTQFSVDTSKLLPKLNLYPLGDLRWLTKTSATSIYVPYSGAIKDVNLNGNNFITSDGTNTSLQQPGEFSINGSGRFSFIYNGGFQFGNSSTGNTINITAPSNPAANRNIIIQDGSGTIPLVPINITGSNTDSVVTIVGTTFKKVAQSSIGGAVTSFNSRTGAVVPVAGDYANLTETLINKTISGSSNTLTNIPNSSLTNNTISGVGLGANLNGLNIGYGLLPNGTNYNGSSAVFLSSDSTKLQTISNFKPLGNTFWALRNGSNASGTWGISITGNAATVTTNANLTGDVISSGNATTFATVNSNVGSFGTTTSIPSFTVNSKGLITAASGNTISYQAPLVSGTNIKTVNSTTLLGSGNLAITIANTDTSGTGFATKASLIPYLTKVQSLADFIQNQSSAQQTANSNITGSGIFGNLGINTGLTTPLGKLQSIETSTATSRGVFFNQYSTDASGSKVSIYKSRGTSASPTTIVAGDNIGGINPGAYDGTNFLDVARFLATSKGTVSTGKIPSTVTLSNMNSTGVLKSFMFADTDQSITHYGISPLLNLQTTADGRNLSFQRSSTLNTGSISNSENSIGGLGSAIIQSTNNSYGSGNDAGLPSGTAITATYSFTIKTTSASTGYIGAYGNETSATGMSFRINTPTDIRIIIANQTSAFTVPAINNGLTHNLIFTLNGNTALLYLDGTTYTTSTVPTYSSVTLNGTFRTAAGVSGITPAMIGTIGQILIYNRVLSTTSGGGGANEIAQIYNSGAGTQNVPQSGLIRCYLITETSGTTIGDTNPVTTQYPLTLSGSPIPTFAGTGNGLVPTSGSLSTITFLTAKDGLNASETITLNSGETNAGNWLYGRNIGLMINSKLPFVANSGGVYIGSTNVLQVPTITAGLMLGAGISTAGGSPFKMQTGTDLTTGELGAFNFNSTGNALKFVPSGTTYKRFAYYTDATATASQTLIGDGSGGFTLASFVNSTITGTPTIIAGAAAGTLPTVSVTSNGAGLQVTVTTGTLPTGTNATIATITLANALSYTPYPVFGPANANTSLLNAASMVYMTSTGTANVTITSGTTALTAATTYIWNIKL